MPPPKRPTGAAPALVITRPIEQGQALADAIEARRPGRFRILFAPLMRIVPVDAEIDLSGVGGLAFTSANGVRAFVSASSARGITAWCVGDHTAAAATAAGFPAVSADGDLPALVDLLAREYRAADGAVLHVRGRHAAGDLAAALSTAGIPVRAVALYDQLPLRLGPEIWAALAAGGIATAFSPRTARLLAAGAVEQECSMAAATSVSLSPAADLALEGAGFGHRLVASRPTRAAMLELLVGL